MVKASPDVVWSIVRNGSCFLRKGLNGAIFSAEKGNLKNTHSFKYSGASPRRPAAYRASPPHSRLPLARGSLPARRTAPVVGASAGTAASRRAPTATAPDAGLANTKTIHLEAGAHEKKIAVAVTVKQAKSVSKPANSLKKSVIARDSRNLLKAVAAQAAKYRPDLKASFRYMHSVLSQDTAADGAFGTFCFCCIHAACCAVLNAPHAPFSQEAALRRASAVHKSLRKQKALAKK